MEISVGWDLITGAQKKSKLSFKEVHVWVAIQIKDIWICVEIHAEIWRHIDVEYFITQIKTYVSLVFLFQ